MKTPRKQAKAILFKNHIRVFGGTDENGTDLLTVDKYIL